PPPPAPALPPLRSPARREGPCPQARYRLAPPADRRTPPAPGSHPPASATTSPLPRARTPWSPGGRAPDWQASSPSHRARRSARDPLRDKAAAPGTGSSPALLAHRFERSKERVRRRLENLHALILARKSSAGFPELAFAILRVDHRQALVRKAPRIQVVEQ